LDGEVLRVYGFQFVGHTYSETDANRYTDTNAYTYCCSNAHTDTNPNCHTYIYSHAHRDADSYTDSKSNYRAGADD